jgi:hypothetical protein
MQWTLMGSSSTRLPVLLTLIVTTGLGLSMAGAQTSSQSATSGSGQYYVEFRSRQAWDYGHTFVVFGRVGETPGKKNVAGLSFRDDASAAQRAADESGIVPHALVRLLRPEDRLAVAVSLWHGSSGQSIRCAGEFRLEELISIIRPVSLAGRKVDSARSAPQACSTSERDMISHPERGVTQ